MTKQKNIQDTLITVGLLVLALIAVSSAGFVVQDTQPISKTMREAYKKELASLKKQVIISHEEVEEEGEKMVAYMYLGEELPAKMAEDEVVELRRDSSWTRQTGKTPDGQAIYESVVYPGTVFIERNGKWYYAEYGKVDKKTFDEMRNPSLFSFVIPSIAHALSQNEYSQRTQFVSAYSPLSWATVQSTTTPYSASVSVSTALYTYVRAQHHTNAGKFDFVSTGWYIDRTFLTFDTSFLPYRSTISAASLNVYATSTKLNEDNDGTDYVTVVETSQPDAWRLATADYDLCGSSVTSPTEGIDAGQRKDITSISLGAYTTFTLNATGRGWIKTNGQASTCGASNQYIVLTSGDSFTVPYNWSSSSNTIEVIGGGGSGQRGATSTANGAGGGGGGGAYSKVTNVGLSPGQTVTYSIGLGGAVEVDTFGLGGTDGGDTYFCNSTSNCASIAGSAVIVGAKGGAQGTDPGSGTANGGSGAGGSSSSGVGTTKYSGGNGGNRNIGGGGGGGGAGGPDGNGGNGGDGGNTSPYTGGGGGGSSGGANGSTGGTDGGAGGNGFGGSGGGAGGTGGGSGSNGTADTGGGGGGGDGNASIGAGSGGTGAVKNQWAASGFGPGGGGGGGGQTTCSACQHGAGGSSSGYGGGGGGGGGGVTSSSGTIGYGNAGAAGVVVLQYANITQGTTCLGLREGHDTTNSAITNNTANSIIFSTQAVTGTSQDPYLAITYTAPFAFWQFFDF